MLGATALWLSGCAVLLPAPTEPQAQAEAAAPPLSVSGAASGAALTGVNGAAAAARLSEPNRASAAKPPSPGQPPAFATVIKDAQYTDGLITVWRKDEKIWFELAPDDLGRLLFLSPKYASGIGERGFFGGLMASTWGLAIGQPQAVEFRRINNQIQLVALNMAYAAKVGTPEAQAVKNAYSPSLLGSAVAASEEHPERKSILVDAASLFVSDLPGIAQALQRSYRQNYSFDARHSAILDVRSGPEQIALEVQNHYATSSISVPQPGSSGARPSVPSTLPDVRSLFMTMHYSLTALPAEPMRPRKADARLGYFTSTVADFSDDLSRSPKQRFVNRWRLEKKDSEAELSEPVKPVTFWLDRSIPEQYRGAVTEGILEWNKAFERIGFQDALRVEVQPEGAEFDTLDTDRASVRWMTNAGATFGAIGPSHVDPRSGEILDADIAFESLSSRSIRNLRSQVLTTSSADFAELLQSGMAPDSLSGATGLAHDPRACLHADHAAEQMAYALDVFEARGDLDPEGPEAKEFVLAYLKDVAMHEVGHTLGLRHNFRASRIYSDAQLSDAEFTQEHGNSGSVMEYAPVNLPAPGGLAGAPFQSTLGPYDYWAIEYAYKPLAAAEEAAGLARIASRSAEPQLAYGTDEDNFLGIDPEAIQFDLGTDPLAFASKRIEIARDLFARQESRELEADENYAVLRRSVSYAVRDVGRASGVLARQIGGVRTLRDHPGSGRDPLQPVSAATQRAALDVLASGVLAPDAFRLSPELQRRLAPDFLEREDAVFANGSPVATDFSLTQTVLDLQRALLAQLMSDGVAARILDSEPKAEKPVDAFHLSELYERLTREVWSELSATGDIPALRRELQREHINRVAELLLRPSAYSRADARSLTRAQAQVLVGRIEVASKRRGLSAEARAHLKDSADTLSQALSARLERAGV
ncbi:MAG: zinc-dependent metalloprotease [Methylibium sp.]|nr:zinc-dependent metalloprotease [Methylibium sp.]